MSRVKNGCLTPVVRRGSLQVPEMRVPRNDCSHQGRHMAADFLRGPFAPHLLVSLDSLVPPPLSDTCLEMRRNLGDVLALAHHAASHLVAISIDY